MNCLLTMCNQELRGLSLDSQPRHWFMWNEIHDLEPPFLNLYLSSCLFLSISRIECVSVMLEILVFSSVQPRDLSPQPSHVSIGVGR